MKNFRAFALLLVTILVAASCGKSVKEAKALGDCKFEISTVDSVYLAGIDINEFKNIKGISDINISKYPGLALAFLSQDIPLSLRTVMSISNPTKRNAAVYDVEYKILLGQSEVFNGLLNRRVEVPAGTQNVLVPVNLKTNIFNLINNTTSRNDLMALFQALGNDGTSNAQTLTIKLKPTIASGNKTTTYPGYITIDKAITADMLKKKVQL